MEISKNMELTFSDLLWLLDVCETFKHNHVKEALLFHFLSNGGLVLYED